MGRPARNHGGTLGHGCLPLPGVRPNFNHHVLPDKTLQRLVHNTDRKPRISTKIEILKDKPCDYVSTKEPKGAQGDRQSVCGNIKEPKRDRQGDSVSSKEPERVQRDRQGDSLSSKVPERVHSGSDSTSIKGPLSTKEPKGAQGDRQSLCGNIKEADRVQWDRQGDSVSSKEKERVHGDRSAESANPVEPERVHNNNPSDSASIIEPKKVLADKPTDSFRMKNSWRAHSDRPNDSVNFNNDWMVYSDRSHDFAEMSKLTVSAGMMSEPLVPMPIHALFPSNEIPGGSGGHFHGPVVLPAASGQVRIGRNCLDCYQDFCFSLFLQHFGAISGLCMQLRSCLFQSISPTPMLSTSQFSLSSH